MTGKQKCRILKEIRRQIAEQNEIRYVTEECRHKGNCRGTCPKCEWEVRMLERELEKRRLSGKKVVLAGISAGFLLTSCAPIDTVKEMFTSAVSGPLEGDMIAETESGAIEETEEEFFVTEGEPAWEDTSETHDTEEPEIAGVPPVPGEVPELEIEGEPVPEDIPMLEGDPVPTEPETEDTP